MSARTFLVRSVALPVALASGLLSAQSKPPAASPALAQEFPVTMRQNIVAGRTPVGTKVEANLTLATLVNGTVVPMGATFVGEVVESAAKSASAPSRLAIRMDSLHWKKQSAVVEVYLTSWYYPLMVSPEELSNDPPPGIGGPLGRGGARRNVPSSKPIPTDSPSGPTSTVSDHRVVMKDIDSVHLNDGTLAITSSRLNIKLDKATTYVLATANLMPAKK
jgi:hypothetical protein